MTADLRDCPAITGGTGDASTVRIKRHTGPCHYEPVPTYFTECTTAG